MRHKMKFLFLAAAIVGLQGVSVWAQRPDPNDPHIKVVEKLRQVLESSDLDEESLDPLLDQSQRQSLRQSIVELHKQTAGNPVADIMLSSKTNGRFGFELPGSMIMIDFQLSEKEPVVLKSISYESEKAAPVNELDWDGVEQRLRELKNQGISGSLFLVRDGKVVLHKGFGLANREKKIPVNESTVFAIGSAPIDFTHAGILWLRDKGKLSLDDPITKYFANVPEDKRAITINHLMTGGSGLPDFHDRPTDANADHSWIDRDEAVRRIFENELLFEPGKGNAHSHSAWGLLAAIIELQSGQSYPEFTREKLFRPAGMNDTGFFGEKVPVERIAVGYGHRESSQPNSPPHWGKTSWLVMGSGGQVSTFNDMWKWKRAIHEGKILNAESSKAIFGTGRQISMDGDMFGFEFCHSHHPESMFMLISNSINSREKRQAFNQFARELVKLTSPARERRRSLPGKFRFGAEMRISSDEGVVIQRVLEGSAAEESGLQAKDQLLTVNGQDLDDEPLDILGPAIEKGEVFELEYLRNGKRMKTRVTPKRR